MKPRRILMLAEHYPPAEQGGSAESVRLEAEALAALGHDVSVLTPRWAPESLEREEVNGVGIWRHEAPAANRERHFWGRRGWASTMRRWAETLLAEWNPDVVHAQEWRAFAALSQLSYKFMSTRQVVTLRDVGLLCPIAVCLLSHRTIPADCGERKLVGTCIPEYRRVYGGHRAYGQRVLGYALRRRLLAKLRYASAVVFPSKALHDVYSPQLETQAVVVSSPVDPREPIPLEQAMALRQRYLLGDRPTILFVGKPSPGKGWGLFTDAAEQLIAKAAFVHVGPLPSWPAVVVPYRGRHGIIHTGPLSRPEVLTWMRASTIVMVPPLGCDTLPRVALEAQAQERFVLATTRGGLPEIVVSTATGLLGEPETIVDALTALLDYGGLGGTSRPRWPWPWPGARNHVLTQFAPAKVAAQLAEVYGA